jgi:hypothetical protein
LGRSTIAVRDDVGGLSSFEHPFLAYAVVTVASGGSRPLIFGRVRVDQWLSANFAYNHPSTTAMKAKPRKLTPTI